MAMVFINGLVIDGLGRSEDGLAVRVDSGRITWLGPREKAQTGSGDDVIDLAGRTLMPGLIDTHVHCVGGDFFPGYDKQPVGLAVLRTADALAKTIAAGFTTIRTAASRDHLDIDMRDAISKGMIPGPTIVASGRGLTITGGHKAGVCEVVDGVDEVRRSVRRHLARGADSIKLMMASGVATGGQEVQVPQFDLEEARMAVAEAHKAGKPVQTHCQGLDAVRTAVLAGADSVDHGDGLDEATAELMAREGIYLVPTFCPRYYYTEMRLAEPWRIERAEQVRGQREAAFTVALENGVPIAMGSDCGAASRMPNGRNALELELMVMNGMSAERAVQAATSEAARLIRRNDVGAVEVGRTADLIVIDGDPLQDIRLLQKGVVYVMQGGAAVRDELAAA